MITGQGDEQTIGTVNTVEIITTEITGQSGQWVTTGMYICMRNKHFDCHNL